MALAGIREEGLELEEEAPCYFTGTRRELHCLAAKPLIELNDRRRTMVERREPFDSQSASLRLANSSLRTFSLTRGLP
jgi:hypothetical protein